MFENAKKEINENIVPGKNAGTSATGLKETLLAVLDDARDAISDANFGIIGAITTSQELSVLNSLPDGVYEAQTSGLYKNGLAAKEGYYTRFRKTANTWSLESETKIPIHDLTPLENSIENIKSQTMIVVKNYIDSSLFERGYILMSGAYSESLNWIRVPYQQIPDELKGKVVTLQGVKNISGGNLVVAIRNSSNELIFSIVGSGSTTPLNHTFTVPLNADTWAFSITNDATDGGIGTRPHDNQFVNTFQLTLGEEIREFIPYNSPELLVKANKLNDANAVVFSNEIEEGNNGAVPAFKIKQFQDKIYKMTIESPNLIDYLNDFESGRWKSTGTTEATVNSIRTKKKNIPQNIIDIISDEKYDDDLDVTVSGGGNVPSAGAILVLYDSNDAVLRTIEGGASTSKFFPFTFQLPYNARKWAFTIANDATDGGIGTRPHDNPFVNTFQVELGSNPTAFKKFGELYIDSDKISTKNLSTNFDTREVIVKKISNTQIHIFYHIGGVNNKWFRVIYYRQTNLDRFIDVWRLNEGYICTRLSEFEFSDVHQVINTGVYENAIYTSGYGYTNALGSAHGWEMLLNNTIFLDGKEINMSDSWINLKGFEFFATTHTNFKSPDGTSNVAQSDKIWRIRDGVLNIQNNIKWFEQINILDNSYVSMCSVFRRNNQGIQVTYKGTSNENLEVFDITEPGFTTTIYSDRNNPNRTSLIAWGDFFKAQMTMKDKTLIRDNVKSVNASSGMNIQNVADPNYNKLYGRFGSMTTQVGDVWNVETEYIFNNI